MASGPMAVADSGFPRQGVPTLKEGAPIDYFAKFFLKNA